jgi:hypothetical protein
MSVFFGVKRPLWRGKKNLQESRFKMLLRTNPTLKMQNSSMAGNPFSRKNGKSFAQNRFRPHGCNQFFVGWNHVKTLGITGLDHPTCHSLLKRDGWLWNTVPFFFESRNGHILLFLICHCQVTCIEWHCRSVCSKHSWIPVVFLVASENWLSSVGFGPHNPNPPISDTSPTPSVVLECKNGVMERMISDILYVCLVVPSNLMIDHNVLY